METKSGCLPSSASHTMQDTMMLPMNVDSTWLHNYEGKPWPVVLCDEQTPPKAFIESRPKGDVLPAILLGKHKYVWVVQSRLKEWNPNRDYFEGHPSFDSQRAQPTGSEDENLELTRRKAFVEDAMEFGDSAYWKNYIDSRSEARKLERQLASKRKRGSHSYHDDYDLGSVQGSTSSSGSPTKRWNRGDGRRSTSHIPTPRPTPRKGWQDSMNIFRSIESDEEDTSTDLRKSTGFPGLPRDLSDPFSNDQQEAIDQDDDEDDEDDEQKLYRIHEERKRHVKNHPPADGICNIFIGPSITPVTVPRDALVKSDVIEDHVSFDKELWTHVNLSDDMGISQTDFEPVRDYLHTDEFAPRLIKAKYSGFDDSGKDRVEGVGLQEEKDDAAKRIAKAYLTAGKLKMPGLQRQCLEKLRALHPLTANCLMIVIATVQRADKRAVWTRDINELLADHVVEYFWHVIAVEGIAFSRLMVEHEDLRRRVIAKLGETAAAPGATMAGLDID